MSIASLQRRRVALGQGGEFRALHERSFAMPNPWDVGSARLMEDAGFPALGTTAAGAAFLRGKSEGDLSPDEAQHLFGEVASAVRVPVAAELLVENPADVKEAAHRARALIEAGVAGISVSDYLAGQPGSLVDIATQLRRIDAVRRIVQTSDHDIVVTARTGAYLADLPKPAEETLRRSAAYAAGGADVVSAAGLLNLRMLRKLSVGVRPVHVEVEVPMSWHVTMSDLSALGVARVNLGSSLAKLAWGGVWRALTQLSEEGSFRGLSGQFLPLCESRRDAASSDTVRSGSVS